MIKNSITILGAGMAGLLAANMMRRHSITIKERKECLPSNHTAVLRFRKTAVSDATGIPFDEAMVDKAFWDGDKICSSIRLDQANLYSRLLTDDEVHPRSIKNMATEKRWIAPNDFVQQMAKNLTIHFGEAVDRPRHDHPVISTIPMPAMMRMVGWEDIPVFNYQPIWTIRCRIKRPHSYVYLSVYNIHPDEWYRATVQRDTLILEFMREPNHYEMHKICNDAADRIFGTYLLPARTKDEESDRAARFGALTADHTISCQPFGKIAPIGEGLRKRFLIHLTDKWNIYSLGRFATWRPILLDDLVKDIQQIERMILSGSTYDRRLVSSSSHTRQ